MNLLTKHQIVYSYQCTDPVSGALGAFTLGTFLRLFPLGHPPLFFCSGACESVLISFDIKISILFPNIYRTIVNN